MGITFTTSPPEISSLWPLAVGRTLGCLFIAGRTLAGWQNTVWQDTEETRIEHTFNAWVSEDDAQALMAAKGAADLVDYDGVVLARKGGDGTEIIKATDRSFWILYPWDLLRLNEELVGRMTASEIQGEVHQAAVIDGYLALGEGSRVLPGVYMEGNVMIGKGCKIGPNCYIRGNTAIGDNCHIGNGVEIKNSLIGNRTNVGHLSYVGDSVLGDHVNLGAGTMTSNWRHDNTNHISKVEGVLRDTGRRKFGSVFGDGVHTGINTSIYPGRKLGPNATTLPGGIVTRDIPDIRS